MNNDDNGANSGRANLVVENSASYGRSVAETEFVMAAMERTMEERSHITTYSRSLAVTDSTMAAMEEQTPL